jgi:hypothetical protein
VEWLSRLPTTPDNPDPMFHVGIGDPNLLTSVQFAGWKKSRVLAQLARGGDVEMRLGGQWAVFVFSGWEHEFRPRLARARACDLHEVRYPAFGDLRHIRNDIIHGHGIASEAETGRCEMLRWFTVGETIAIGAVHIAEFTRSVPWEAMVEPTP